MRILNVDDSAENRYLLESMLRPKGHEVISSSNGVQALQQLEQRPFDLIVSDILMPHMDGFQLCREVKRREALRNIPFIFYTATYTDKKDREFALSLGAACFLVKPQEPAAFVAVIRRVVEAARGWTQAPPAPEIENEAFLVAYNQRLVRKLEGKLLDQQRLSARLQAALEAREREASEREQAEQALGESEASLARAQRTAHLGSWEVALDGSGDPLTQPLRCSDELLRILAREGGGAPLTLAGDLLAAVPNAERSRVEAILRRAIDQRVPGAVEYRLARSDGSERVVQGHFELASDLGAGRPAKLVGTVQDVTDRKQVEEALRQAQKMESFGLLAGGIAHDFNNLLSVIAANTSLLVQDGKLDGEATEVAREISASVERASALTQQILAFSRRQGTALRRIDLNDAVHDLFKLLSRVIGPGVVLECDLYPDPLPILGDLNMLQQVLLNLVVNARDAVSERGRIVIETCRTRVDAARVRGCPEMREGEAASLSVRDDGCGIAPEKLALIFDPFFTTKEAGRGTGLGLATARRIVEQHLGCLLVESVVGKGSTFRALLPLLLEPKTAEHASRPSPGVRSG